MGFIESDFTYKVPSLDEKPKSRGLKQLPERLELEYQKALLIISS
ncbi:hypothetical protein O53_3212 [Microcystis aeruginosa TAIHU98]|uniref:Uncharacterized protein n=1 Tax=Microcystis aeruginosa TAIHU98 TaxID=1134457 RepID=L7E5S9_MICAE|nr:hypothetical protein O53_3212 [Microcystis aeruginosa TAIHU98]